MKNPGDADEATVEGQAHVYAIGHLDRTVTTIKGRVDKKLAYTYKSSKRGGD